MYYTLNVNKTATFKKVNFSNRFLELTSSAIALMWYGSNPQQPPIYLTPKSQACRAYFCTSQRVKVRGSRAKITNKMGIRSFITVNDLIHAWNLYLNLGSLSNNDGYSYENVTYRGGSRIFFRRGAIVSCSTSTPIDHIFFFFFCRIPVVLENRRSSRGGGGEEAHALHPPPRSAPDLKSEFALPRTLLRLFYLV